MEALKSFQFSDLASGSWRREIGDRFHILQTLLHFVQIGLGKFQQVIFVYD